MSFDIELISIMDVGMFMKEENILIAQYISF